MWQGAGWYISKPSTDYVFHSQRGCHMQLNFKKYFRAHWEYLHCGHPVHYQRRGEGNDIYIYIYILSSTYRLFRWITIKQSISINVARPKWYFRPRSKHCCLTSVGYPTPELSSNQRIRRNILYISFYIFAIVYRSTLFMRRALYLILCGRCINTTHTHTHTHICIYIIRLNATHKYICEYRSVYVKNENDYKILTHWPNRVMVRVFNNGTGERGSIPDQVILKILKTYT